MEYIASHLLITPRLAVKNHKKYQFVVKVNRGGTRAPEYVQRIEPNQRGSAQHSAGWLFMS